MTTKQDQRKGYYGLGYHKAFRYVLYHYQVFSAARTKPGRILDIGIGDKTTSEQLKKLGFSVTTCDICPELEPDVVGDVRKLPFGDNEFDTVIACEILEHLPFVNFDKSLRELKRVAGKYVIMSIPYSGTIIGGNFYFNFLGKKRQFNLFLKIPNFFKKINVNKNKRHYWEMGAMGCSKRKIRNIVRQYFFIEREFHVPYSPGHYFFILKAQKNR